MKKRGNRWLYFFIIIEILLITGITIYALSPGFIPSPGHDTNEISIPPGCIAGQFLKYDGTNWVCSDLT